MISKKIIPHLVLIIAMILWSSSFIGFKVALTVYNPFEVVAGRMIFASIFCIPVAKEVWQILKNKKLRFFLLLGVLSEPCFYFLFETFALHYTSAAQAGMVLALTPLFVGAGAWFFLSEKLPLQTWLGFIVAVVGILWLSFSSKTSITAPNPLLGNILELCAVLCAVGYTLCVRHLVRFVRPLVYTAAMAFGGAIFYIPLAFLPITIEPVVLDVIIPSWMPFASIAYLGCIVSLLGYGSYNYGLARLPAGEVAAYMNLIPLITLGMGVLWLGESFRFIQYVAAGLVVFGIILSQTAKKE